MEHKYLSRWFNYLVIVALLFSLGIDGKGFGGRGGGGGGFKGGSRGGTSFGSSSNFGRPNTYSGNSMNRPRSGSSGLKTAAIGFGAGAVGGLAAYSLMRHSSSGYHGGSGYYRSGYGTGATCTNTYDFNGTSYGTFRCPLNNFPLSARYCCGEPSEQFCCDYQPPSHRRMPHASHFAWLLLLVAIIIFIYILWTRRRRSQQKEIIMVPTEPPMGDQPHQPFYHPPQPPMGYPPPPGVSPYANPSHNQGFGYNPYAQQTQTPYPNQQQQQFNSYPTHQQQQFNPYPNQQQQQQPFNPYQVKEGGPPGYDEAVQNNK